MDEGCAWIIGIIVVIVIVFAVVVYVILPVTLFVIGSIAIAGAGSGIYVASKNFREIVIEAHKTVK
jgi:hypothetical protein